MTIEEAGNKLDFLVKQSIGLSKLSLTEFLVDKKQHLTLVSTFDSMWNEYPFDLKIAVDVEEIENQSDDTIINLLIKRCRIILIDVISSCTDRLWTLAKEVK